MIARLARPLRGLVVASAYVFVVGCGVPAPASRTYDGPVTAVGRHTVCIGGPDASGECFLRDRLTRSLRVSDCVRVTYTPHDSPGPSTATQLQHLDAATHTTACPPQ